MPSPIARLLAQPTGAPIKLEPTLLKAQIVELLRSHIVQGRIPPGTALVERDLAETLEVSRLPVREALQELEKDGLIVSTASNRRSVIRLSERDIRELYEVRLRLETLAVERAAERTTAVHQAQLHAILVEMQHAFDAHDPTAFPKADIALHQVIWEHADNHHLQTILTSMSGRLYMFVARHSQLYTWDEVIPLHTELVQCINAGDVAGARESIEQHMQNSLARALNAFIPTE